MKRPFIAHRNIAFIFFIFLAIFGLHVTSYADVIPVGEPEKKVPLDNGKGGNTAPVFTEGEQTTRQVDENTAAGVSIGKAVAATDVDNRALVYKLGGKDAAAFGIHSMTGQLKTKAALNYETKKSYTVTVTASDGKLADKIVVTISVKDVNEAPVFKDGKNTTRQVDENTAAGVSIGKAVTAADVDNRALVYKLGGKDAAAFGIHSITGQLKTKAVLDYETKKSYTVSVTASDGKLTANIDVTINVKNVNEAPVFSDGKNVIRQVDENTAAGVSIGKAVAATDVDNRALVYKLGGKDAAAFGIHSMTGQLQTKAALDYETKKSYTVTVTASDGRLADKIVVTINVKNVNEAPVFTDGENTTRQVDENTAAGVNFGQRVSSTDPDANATLTYSLGGRDADAFAIDSTTGQLQTKAALNYETKNSYILTATVSDGRLTDTIDITINVTDVHENSAPVFTEGTSTIRSVAENTAADENIGTAVSATDPDDDTLTYTLTGTDASSFSLDSSSGQLKTKAALDHETKDNYSVTISVSDADNATNSITVTISVTDTNEAPVFADGTSTTRSVDENTVSGQNIGSPISATDEDAGTTFTYTLSGTDAAAFSIVNTSGQLQTSAALDYETKSSYAVTITVSDGNLTDTISVSISVTDMNDAPVFSGADPIIRAIAENVTSGQNIGSPISATDEDAGTTLTYTLSGTDAAAFNVDSRSGRLQTSAALDYETKSSYSVTLTVSDGSLTDTIGVLIRISNVNEAPVFSEGGSITRSVDENTVSGQNIGSPISATDVDANTRLTYRLRGTDAAVFSIVSTSGQLQTSAALDYETKSSYAVTVVASDGNLTDTISVSISVADMNDAPVFSGADPVIREIAENTISGQNIGNPVSATDEDAGTTLTYTLGGTDAAAFNVDSTSGQLRTRAALDYEAKSSYAVTVVASDGSLTDTIDVLISVTDVNDAPVFTEGTNTIRAVAERSRSRENIGSAVSATDQDNDPLTYTLEGIDAPAFRIVDTSGQLQTRVRLDYETKSTYFVTVTVSDGNLTDAIDVTINVTDINDPPMFTGDTDLIFSLPENTSAGENIGSAVSATDQDNDPLTYTLEGVDAAAFGIVSTSGQLQTKAALDYETQFTYDVSVAVSDRNGGNDRIDVTIHVTNVFEATPLRERTPAVMEAIMSELEWIGNVDDVTEYDLLSVRLINMSGHSLTTLKSGDFSGLDWVRLLYIPSNSLESLPEDIFDGLILLETINLTSNSLESLPEDIFDGLSNLENLYLASNSLESLPGGIFDGLPLTSLDLGSNALTSLPDGLFSGVSNLGFLRLQHNATHPMPLTVSLKKVAEGQFKATIHSGAPAPIELPVSVTNGSISDGATSIIVPAGQVESDVTLTVTRTAGTTAPVSVNIGTLPVRPFSTLWVMRPFSNSGYRLVKSEDLPLEVIPAIAGAPNAPAQVPKVTAFLPNYPNPFNPETWIPYQLAKPSDVTLTIYNMKGNIVRQLALGHKPAGFYQSRTRAAYWDGRNGLGEKVATGVYFCTFKAGEFTATRKMLILK